MDQKKLTFLHSGDMGDIVAGLATVKEICEKENAKARLFLDSSGGTTCNSKELNEIIIGQTKGKGLKFNNAGLLFLKPMIECQDYISSVEKWIPELKNIEIDYNLNEFRRSFCDIEVAQKTNQNLEFLHQNAMGLEFGYKGPWLSCPYEKLKSSPKVIVSRSMRVHSAYAYYVVKEEALSQDYVGFIGMDDEYEVFKQTFRYQPPRYKVENALDILRAIDSAEVVIVNSTMLYWIAVGYGHKNIIHELPLDIPTSYYPNEPKTIHYVQGMHFIS